MYKQQQLRYSNQNINGVNSSNNNIIGNYNNNNNVQLQPNYSYRPSVSNINANQAVRQEINDQPSKNSSNHGSLSPNHQNAGLQNAINCPPSPTLSSVLKAANQKKQCKISYLFCNQTNHEMNQLNMACLKFDCPAKGLICCMCLDDHYDHLKHCIAFQKIVTQLKGKIDKNSAYYEENLMSQTSESKDYLTSIEQDFKDIQNTIDSFKVQVNQYLELLKIQYEKQYMESIEKIKSLCSNAGTSLKDFFEKIEINSIIGQSLHTNPATDLKFDINSFLQNVEMSEDLKSIKLKMDSAMNKQSEELANQIKRKSKGLKQQFQKYMVLLNNQDLKFSQSGIVLSGSGRESQISSGSNSQYQNSTRKKRKYEKLIEKEQNKLIKCSNQKYLSYMKPISIVDSSETNSQRQNLDHAVLLSTPSSENHINNNYCLSFQDKKAFLNGPHSSSRGSERKLNDFNLSDYIAQSSQSATQSRKGSVQKHHSTLNHKQRSQQQHTFGKPQVEISMECEDENFSSEQLSQRLNYLNQLRKMKANKRYVIEDEESSKQPSQSLHSSKQLGSLNREREEEEEFEDEDEPYEEDMIGRSDDSRYYDDYEDEEDQEQECNVEEQQQQQQCQQNYQNNIYKSPNNINRKSQQLNQSNGVASDSKIEYSSSKKTQPEEIMSFQMPIRNQQSQSQDRVSFDLQQYDQIQNGNNLFTNVEQQRIPNNSPNINQISHNHAAESPTFQRNTADPQIPSKIQNRKTIDYQSEGKLGGNVNSNSSSSNQQTIEIEYNNKQSSSPKSKQASTKATSCNNLSPKSRSHSPNPIHVLDNSPTRPVTRSSAKKMQSKENELNSEQQREEQQNIESYQSNLEQQQQQFYNDQMMYQEQSVQILEVKQPMQRTSQQKEQQSTVSAMKSPTTASTSMNLNSNSGSKNKNRKMKRSSGSRLHENLDLLKIEHNSQQSSNNPSGQKQ